VSLVPALGHEKKLVLPNITVLLAKFLSIARAFASRERSWLLISSASGDEGVTSGRGKDAICM
jgi:hypothetical protein